MIALQILVIINEYMNNNLDTLQLESEAPKDF